MTHFNLMDNARRGILAEFVFSNLAFVSALVVNKTDNGFNNCSLFLFIRKKVCLTCQNRIIHKYYKNTERNIHLVIFKLCRSTIGV